ncbi:MAG: lytic transglycosylase domain-containing protein [Myxococcota bacterium]
MTLFPSLAWAQLYSYVDDDGVLHFTNLRKGTKKRWRVVEGSTGDGFGGQPPLVLELEGKPRVVYAVNVGRFDALFREAAKHYRLPFALLKAVAKVESNFDPSAVSHAHAKGLMQLIDDTARAMKVEDPFDPRQNVFGGARYLRTLANLFEGDLVRTTAAYNAGPERVKRAGGVPNIRETRRYVQRVMEMYRHYRLAEGSR